MKARFCPTCAGRLTERRLQPEEPARQVCEGCGRVHYRNAKPSVSALIIRDGRVLLARRGHASWRGRWDLPGGFLEEDEHPATGVVRETREETGLEVQVSAEMP
jgi:NADH pyrophosphatase NudC (nudix superfamily)